MKITFVLPGSGRSGGIKVAVQAANGLLKRNHEVRLLVKTGNATVKTGMRRLWLKMCYPQSSSWFPLFKGRLENFNDLTRCRFERNEVVVAHGWWAARELRRLKHNTVIKVHYVHSTLKDKDLMKAAWGENVPKIVVASYLEDVIAEIVGQKITAVIPNGIDADEYYPTVPDNARDGVGTIFAWGYQKDPKTVLAVLKSLRESCPQTPLRVFGACRMSKQMPRGVYCRLPSAEKITKIYSSSLVWFMASSSEGFGLPIVEAMACGCAVVATDCGGPRDIIVDGKNGFLVEVGSAEQIVDKVKLLLHDSKLRRQFVRASEDTVRKFSLACSIDKLEEVLYSLAKGNSV